MPAAKARVLLQSEFVPVESLSRTPASVRASFRYGTRSGAFSAVVPLLYSLLQPKQKLITETTLSMHFEKFIASHFSAAKGGGGLTLKGGTGAPPGVG